MKKIFTTLIAINLFLIALPVFAQTPLSLADRQQIIDKLDRLVQAINEGDMQAISSLISPNDQALQSKIEERIQGGIEYRLDYTPFNENIETLNANQIKVTARFSASGLNWKTSGYSTYFVFEKQNDQWFIVDTDLYSKWGMPETMKIVSVFIVPLLILLSILLFIFWLLMLIDCVDRKFDDKIIWIVLLIFCSFIGSILYYFIIKRKDIKRKPLEFKM